MKKPTSQGGPNQSNSILDPVTAHRLDPLVDKFAFIPCSGKVPLIKNWPNKDGFHIDEILSSPRCTSIGVKTGLHLLCLDFDGQTAFEYARTQKVVVKRGIGRSWQVHRDDEPWRLKVLFTPTPLQVDQLPSGEFQSTVQTKAAIKNDKGKIIKKKEALEVFLGNKQVIILGKHPDGGNFYWGSDPEDLIAPPDAAWELVLKLAHQKNKLKKSAASLTSSSVWIAARPCPICSRDKDDDCRTNRAGDVVLCHQGETFHPPHLNKGEVINGWAFCGSGEDCIGTFSTFRKHRSNPVEAIRKRLAGGDYG